MPRANDLVEEDILESRYRLIQKLGESRLSVVWEVADLEAKGDRKAIKFCKSHNYESVMALRREFLTIQRLQQDSQNGQAKYIIQVEKLYPLKKPERDDRIPLHFFVMEKVTGSTLEDLILKSAQIDKNSTSLARNLGRSLYQFCFYRYPFLRSHISYLQIANWLEQLTKTLQYLHSQNLIYCDLKPANIMITDDGNIKLIDFGAIKNIEDRDAYQREVATQSAQSAFTVEYAAPEQLLRAQILPKSDFYSLGRTLLFALTGLHPSKLEELANGKQDQNYWRSQFPPELSNFLIKVMDVDPLQRHRDAEDLAREGKFIAKSLRYQFGEWAIFKQMLVVAGVAAIATASTLGLRSTGILQTWELQAYDQIVRMRPDFVDSRKQILIVAIEPQDAEWMQGRSVPNYVLTKAIQNLLFYKSKVIGITIARDQPSTQGISELKQVLQNNKNIFGSCEPNSDKGRGFSFYPKPSTSLGFGSVLVDRDNYNRRQILFDSNHSETVDKFCPEQLSFNLIVANYALQNYSDHKESIKNKTYSLNGSHSLQRLQGESIYQGIGVEDEAFDDTFQIMIDYRSLDRIATKVSIRDVVENKISPDLIRDRVVLIGRMDSSEDRPHMTPYGEMFTVELRSQVISQLIDIGKNKRPILSLASLALDFYLACFISVFTSFLSWRFTFWQDKTFAYIYTLISLYACCWLVLSISAIYLGFVPFLIISSLVFCSKFVYTWCGFRLIKIYNFRNERLGR